MERGGIGYWGSSGVIVVVVGRAYCWKRGDLDLLRALAREVMIGQ